MWENGATNKELFDFRATFIYKIHTNSEMKSKIIIQNNPLTYIFFILSIFFNFYSRILKVGYFWFFLQTVNNSTLSPLPSPNMSSSSAQINHSLEGEEGEKEVPQQQEEQQQEEQEPQQEQQQEQQEQQEQQQPLQEEEEWVPDDPPSFWFEDTTRGEAFEEGFNQAEDQVHRSAIERMAHDEELWNSVMASVQAGCATLDAEFDRSERQRLSSSPHSPSLNPPSPRSPSPCTLSPSLSSPRSPSGPADPSPSPFSTSSPSLSPPPTPSPPASPSSSSPCSSPRVASTQSSFLPSSFEKITPTQAESLLRWAILLSEYADGYRDKKHTEKREKDRASNRETELQSGRAASPPPPTSPPLSTHSLSSSNSTPLASPSRDGIKKGGSFLGQLLELRKDGGKNRSSPSINTTLKLKELEKKKKVLIAEHFFAMAHGQFVAGRPVLRTRPDFYFFWALSSLRFSHLMEKEGKDLPLAFALSIFSGFLFERSLSLDIYQPRAWKKWSRVIDTLLYLYPTNNQVKQMITIFLTSYKAVLIPEVPIFEKTPIEKKRQEKQEQKEEQKKNELRGTLSLKPLVALALSRDLEDSLKRQAVSLLRDVSRNGATTSLKQDAIQCLTYLLPIVEQQEVLLTGKGRIPYNRLPEKAKRMVIESKMPASDIKEHYDILLNCLSFLVYIPGLPSDDPFKPRQKRPVPMPEYIKYVSESPSKIFFSGMTKIGGGAYGNVFVAKPKHAFAKEIGIDKKQLPEKVAIKACKCRSPSDFAYIREEVKLHREIDHKNFVGYLGTFFYDNHVWIVLNFCDGGSLYDVLRQRPKVTTYPVIPEGVMAYIAYEVLQGLKYLHEHNRIHRDIKSDNILLDSKGGVKIADLGECTALTSMETSMRMAGSRFWMAPEIILRHPYGTKADVYSFGALLMEMIEGDPPYWTHRSLKALFYTALYGPPPIRKSAQEYVSESLVDLVKQSMDPNPSSRPTSEELLKHPFFKKRTTAAKVCQFLEGWPESCMGK